MKKIIYLFVIVLLLFNCSGKYDEVQTSVNNNYRDNFESMWTLLDEEYCYFTIKNIDWQAVYDSVSPKIDLVTTEYELFDVLSQLIDPLQDAHVFFKSPFSMYANYNCLKSEFPDYNRKLLSQYLSDNPKYISSSSFMASVDNGNIGFLSLVNFTDNFSSATIKYIREYFNQFDKMIIDVRENGGGAVFLAEQFASSFFKEKTLVGYDSYKAGPGHDDFGALSKRIISPTSNEAIADWTDKKVAVLINRGSYSATNDFALMMKSAPNVTLIGSKTGGGGSSPICRDLPNGWTITFSSGPTFDLDMKHIELGIEPDIKVHVAENDTEDNIILKAIEILNK